MVRGAVAAVSWAVVAAVASCASYFVVGVVVISVVIMLSGSGSVSV
jgi:hypothetical protein